MFFIEMFLQTKRRHCSEVTIVTYKLLFLLLHGVEGPGDQGLLQLLLGDGVDLLQQPCPLPVLARNAVLALDLAETIKTPTSIKLS